MTDFWGKPDSPNSCSGSSFCLHLQTSIKTDLEHLSGNRVQRIQPPIMPTQPKRYSYYVGKKWTYLYAYTPRVVFKSVRALTSHISLDTTTTFKGGLFLPAKSSDTHTRRERTHLCDGRHLGNTPAKMSSWQTRWPTFILSGCMRVCVYLGAISGKCHPLRYQASRYLVCKHTFFGNTRLVKIGDNVTSESRYCPAS